MGSLSLSATAQVTTDGTTNTTVGNSGNDFTIENGDRAGNNLFHSFNSFSVPNGGSAIFNNAPEIANIFSRVTGGNISNINGLIQANDTNLFLINPAGIIFGANARLDIGGSFLGTTADSILFEDGELNATDFDNPPLLTVNAPIGLGFRDNLGDIINHSVGINPNETNVTGSAVGLQVSDGKTLALIGGNILLDNGNLTSKGGQVDIGGVTSGEVTVNQTEANFALDYDSVVSFGDVRLENTSVVDVNNQSNGSINLNANNISILGGSSLNAGISPGLGTTEAQSGNIVINAKETLTVTNSRIHNIINNQAIGNSGDILIRASQVEVLETLNSNVDVDSGNFLNNGIFSSVNLEGQGNAGNISIESQKINISGNGARIGTSTLGEGNAGNLTIQTAELSVLDGAQIGTSTFGQGNAGIFMLNASESVDVSGSSDFSSGLFANVNVESESGNAGSLNIDTKRLSISDGGLVLAGTSNSGDPGTLTVNASESLSIQNGGQLSVSSFGTGSGGNLIVNTSKLLVEGDGARLEANAFSAGDGGDLTITTQELLVQNGGQVQAVAFSDGSAGNLIINASNSIELRGATEEVRTGLFASAIDNNENGGSGDGGNLTIFTDKLIIEDGATAGVSNFQSLNLVPPGRGAAGNLEINANSIELNGGIISAANANGVGGGLEINADSLNLDNSSSINAFTTSDTGQGGIINLNLNNNLFLRGNSEISARTENGATGGSINIDTEFVVAFPNQIDGNGNDIVANALQGNGGDININAEALLGLAEGNAVNNNQRNDIDASSDFGLDGNVSIFTPDVNTLQGATELPSNVVQTEQTVAEVCAASGNTKTANGLVIKGKGGTPDEPTDALGSENITVSGEPDDDSSSDLKSNYAVATAQGDIVPAMGAIVTEDGQVILTAEPVDRHGRGDRNWHNCLRS